MPHALALSGEWSIDYQYQADNKSQGSFYTPPYIESLEQYAP